MSSSILSASGASAARIAFLDLFEQGLNGALLEVLAKHAIGLGALRKAVQEGIEVEMGATGEDRLLAAAPDVHDKALGVAREVSCAIRVLRIPDIDEVMRDALHVLLGGLLGPYIEHPVYLAGIDRYDFAA